MIASSFLPPPPPSEVHSPQSAALRKIDGSMEGMEHESKDGRRAKAVEEGVHFSLESSRGGQQAGLTADCTNNIADSTVMSPLKPDAAPRPSLRRSDSRELDGHRSGGGHSGSTLHSFHNFRTWASFHPSASAASPLALLQLCCQMHYLVRIH